MVLNPKQKLEAKSLLAANFWKTSSAAKSYPNLAWCATRVHGMSVVTSKLERFFSHVGDVQTDNRALTAQRAALYASAHSTMIAENHSDSQDPDSIHRSLVALVRRCEDPETERAVYEFEEQDGFSDLEQWVSKVT
jgi:hypothetical protein